MHALITVERFVEGPPITLSLHVPGFNLPFLEEVGHPFSDIVVVHHVSEVIQCQILHLSMIPFREANHFGCAKMLVLAQVSCCQGFETVSHHVAVELHQHADEGKVLRRNVTLKAAVAIISERQVLRRLEPIIEAINCD